MTASEKEWFRALNRYSKRFEREVFRSGHVTHASMRRQARLSRDCRARLVRGADPGRFEPAAAIVRRACARLGNAAKLLERAISVSDPGGAVIAGTEEAAIFERSHNRATEAMGNAQYNLQRAQERAQSIEARLNPS